MATPEGNKLNALFTKVPPGTPLTSAHLADLGISSNLAGQYAKAGWLSRLSHGVYARANDVLDLHRALAVLQKAIAGLHVGGKTALDWHGVRHYVSHRPTLHLFGWETASLPGWFTERFPADYRRKRLFREEPQAMPHVLRHESGESLVSSPERALLEMLSEVGLHQHCRRRGRSPKAGMLIRVLCFVHNDERMSLCDEPTQMFTSLKQFRSVGREKVEGDSAVFAKQSLSLCHRHQGWCDLYITLLPPARRWAPMRHAAAP